MGWTPDNFFYSVIICERVLLVHQKSKNHWIPASWHLLRTELGKFNKRKLRWTEPSLLNKFWTVTQIYFYRTSTSNYQSLTTRVLTEHLLVWHVLGSVCWDSGLNPFHFFALFSFIYWSTSVSYDMHILS